MFSTLSLVHPVASLPLSAYSSVGAPGYEDFELRRQIRKERAGLTVGAVCGSSDIRGLFGKPVMGRVVGGPRYAGVAEGFAVTLQPYGDQALKDGGLSGQRFFPTASRSELPLPAVPFECRAPVQDVSERGVEVLKRVDCGVESEVPVCPVGSCQATGEDVVRKEIVPGTALRTVDGGGSVMEQGYCYAADLEPAIAARVVRELGKWPTVQEIRDYVGGNPDSGGLLKLKVFFVYEGYAHAIRRRDGIADGVKLVDFSSLVATARVGGLEPDSGGVVDESSANAGYVDAVYSRFPSGKEMFMCEVQSSQGCIRFRVPEGVGGTKRFRILNSDARRIVTWWHNTTGPVDIWPGVEVDYYTRSGNDLILQVQSSNDSPPGSIHTSFPYVFLQVESSDDPPPGSIHTSFPYVLPYVVDEPSSRSVYVDYLVRAVDKLLLMHGRDRSQLRRAVCDGLETSRVTCDILLDGLAVRSYSEWVGPPSGLSLRNYRVGQVPEAETGDILIVCPVVPYGAPSLQAEACAVQVNTRHTLIAYVFGCADSPSGVHYLNSSRFLVLSGDIESKEFGVLIS